MLLQGLRKENRLDSNSKWEVDALRSRNGDVLGKAGSGGKGHYSQRYDAIV